MSRPNIVLICSDQHRATSIGAYGSKVCRTPNLDRLASRGVVMERCFAQNPICMPSRSTIMTGVMSRNHGVVSNDRALTRELPTIADVCAAAGYRTAAFGKMHLTPEEEGVPAAPHYGFQHLECVGDNKLGAYLDWVLKNFPEHKGYILGTLFNLPRGPELQKEVLAAREKFVKPHEISATANWGFGHYSPLPAEASTSTWITDRALRYLDSKSEEPMLMWVSYVDPHNPFAPPRRTYRAEDVETRLETDEANLAPQTRAVRAAYYNAFTEQDHRTLRALYYDSVTFMDEQIGRLLKAVEKMPNTIVIYLSDHGELLGDFRLYGKSAYHYDSCIRVPMICRWDGHWTAKRDNAIMELTDLMPTVLEAAGLEGPAMDGVSFAGRLAGGTAPREYAFIESYRGLPEDPSPAPVTWARTIRSDRYRATFCPRSEFGELYDLQNDPHELRNVWKEQPNVREEHRRLLCDRLLAAEFPLR